MKSQHLTSSLFHTLLQTMNPEKMAEHSVLKHHADCLDYLCLHRSEDLTVKLYLIEKPENTNSGFLVNPHSHRYAFSSIMLAGSLQHLRLTPAGWINNPHDSAEFEIPFDLNSQLIRADGKLWGEVEYNPDSRVRVDKDTWYGLYPTSRKIVTAGDTYFVKPHEIHTLKMLPEISPGPVLIGLVQFKNERETSRLFLPKQSRYDDHPHMEYPASRVPDIEETEALRNRCLQLMPD